ncbi:MAG TPA: hypothetical protein PKK06_15660 [Phycisphaerae bacterium]|nr:hypothetical protein [Phycisphaerae bacterium]HNU46764.1 hypothetical protein [Phycisphaerae bacterium]
MRVGSGRRAGVSAWWMLLLISASVVVAPGCASTSPGPVGEGLVVASNPHEPDLPLPAGFHLVERSSEDFRAGALRYIRHRYVGRADKPAVRDFYRRQMPLVRWVSLSDNQVEGRYTMRFERADETCTITIDGEPGARSGQVRVEVIVAPKPQPGRLG